MNRITWKDYLIGALCLVMIGVIFCLVIAIIYGIAIALW